MGMFIYGTIFRIHYGNVLQVVFIMSSFSVPEKTFSANMRQAITCLGPKCELMAFVFGWKFKIPGREARESACVCSPLRT
jgi:hypothetical protein